MSLSEPKYEIKRDPYHEATLVYSGQNSQGTRSYHTERVNAPSVSNSVIHSIHGILTKVFKTHSVTTDLIDSSYLYGAGIDLQWNTLWGYRSIHGQTTMAFLQDHYFSSHKDEYFQQPMQDERIVEVLGAWGVAHIPLFIQKGLEFAQEVSKKENDHDVVERIMFEQIIKWVAT